MSWSATGSRICTTASATTSIFPSYLEPLRYGTHAIAFRQAKRAPLVLSAACTQRSASRAQRIAGAAHDRDRGASAHRGGRAREQRGEEGGRDEPGPGADVGSGQRSPGADVGRSSAADFPFGCAMRQVCAAWHRAVAASWHAARRVHGAAGPVL